MRSKEFSKMKDLKIHDSDENMNVSRRGNENIRVSKFKRLNKSRLKCFFT